MLFSRQLRQFIEVVRQGSFVQAAEIISVTPSALSHGIHELESRIGKKLLERKNKKVIPTQHGRRLYNEILPLYEKAQNIFSDLSDDEATQIVIGIDGFYFPSLARKLSSILSAAGQQITIQNTSLSCIHEGILNNVFDVSIGTSLEPVVPGQGICRVALAPERVGLVGTEALFRRYRDTSTLLSQESLIQCSSTLEHPVYQRIIEKTEDYMKGGTFIGLPDIADVCHAISDGVGVSLMTKEMMRHPSMTSTSLHFEPSPFPVDILLHRGVYFKKSRYEDLIDIVMNIRG